MTNKFSKYVNSSYNGIKLLEKHKLTDTGVWEIHGEDPSYDMSGHHYQPYIGTVTGRLADVIAYAVEQLDFWTCGVGGNITLHTINIKKVGSLALEQQQQKRELLQNLELQVATLKKELGIK